MRGISVKYKALVIQQRNFALAKFWDYYIPRGMTTSYCVGLKRPSVMPAHSPTFLCKFDDMLRNLCLRWLYGKVTRSLIIYMILAWTMTRVRADTGLHSSTAMLALSYFLLVVHVVENNRSGIYKSSISSHCLLVKRSKSKQYYKAEEAVIYYLIKSWLWSFFYPFCHF